MKPARQSRSTTPTTITRSPTVPVVPWLKRGTIRGSSLPPTMPWPRSEQMTAGVVKANGGQVLGGVRVPINTSDFSSALLQAQSSKAKVVGLANAGADTQNFIKQAAEFGIVRGGQKLAGLLVFINDVNSLSLDVAQGMLLTMAFYWDRNDESRAWAQRYLQRMNRMPNMAQAGIYSSTMHYLKAVAAAGTDEINAVMDKMRATPINDFFAKNGTICEDGRWSMTCICMR